VEIVMPVANIDRSTVRFRMHPEEQVRCLLLMEELGLALTAIYHSHPQGPSGPSQTDLAEAAFPESIYLIASRSKRGWTARAFRLMQPGAEEVALELGKRVPAGRGQGR
jgi:proteasome lid subunit RPN8/RPN11